MLNLGILKEIYLIIKINLKVNMNIKSKNKGEISKTIETFI